MITHGLLVRLEAKSDRDDDTEEFLRSALPLVQDEPATIAWFALKFGRSDYGIFDAFPDESGRNRHLDGAVAKALRDRTNELFARPPQIEQVELLAHKLPAQVPTEPATKGVLLRLKSKAEHAEHMENFLRDAQHFVEEEPKTLAWFALRFGNGSYGIFDVFPDQSGRLAHLTGRVPRELAKHPFALLGGVPDPHMLDVLAEKIEVPVGV